MNDLEEMIQHERTDGIRAELARRIKNGTLTKRKLDRTLNLLKQSSVGKSILADYHVFSIKNNPSEWSKDYLEDLATAIVCGDVSEALLKHMVDVSKKTNRQKALLKYGLFAFVALVLAVIVFVVLR